MNRWRAGGQIGYRWQVTNWVFGLEAHGDWANLRNSNASVFLPLVGYEGGAPSGDTVEERLSNLGSEVLKRLLADDNVDFIRLAVAESRRFPDLAKVGRMARERGAQNAAAVFKEVADSKQGRAYPAFASARLAKTTQFFLDLVVAPLLMRAVLGEDPKSLRAQIRSHVAESVAFFLSACRSV